MSGRPIPEARPAATVVLLREGAPFDVFFVKRHGKSGFMANAWVFPGGRVDASDSDAGPPAGWTSDPRAQDLSHETAWACRVAAVRETFEESGALLATQGAQPLTHQTWRAAMAQRDALNDGEISWPELTKQHALSVRGQALTYFAHWITPEAERRRYDTRFYMACMPAGQEPEHDARETTDSCWATPKDALARYHAGDFQLAPPTWHILRSLAERRSLQDALAWAAASPAPPTQPRLTTSPGGIVLALPGDPLHDRAAGETVSRIVVDRGRWRAEGRHPFEV